MLPPRRSGADSHFSCYLLGAGSADHVDRARPVLILAALHRRSRPRRSTLAVGRSRVRVANRVLRAARSHAATDSNLPGGAVHRGSVTVSERAGEDSRLSGSRLTVRASLTRGTSLTGSTSVTLVTLEAIRAIVALRT